VGGTQFGGEGALQARCDAVVFNPAFPPDETSYDYDDGSSRDCGRPSGSVACSGLLVRSFRAKVIGAGRTRVDAVFGMCSMVAAIALLASIIAYDSVGQKVEGFLQVSFEKSGWGSCCLFLDCLVAIFLALFVAIFLLFLPLIVSDFQL
jgi:hypothetical protein